MLLLKLLLLVCVPHCIQGEWDVFTEKLFKLCRIHEAAAERSRKADGSLLANVRGSAGPACCEEDCTLFAVLLQANKWYIAHKLTPICAVGQNKPTLLRQLNAVSPFLLSCSRRFCCHRVNSARQPLLWEDGRGLRTVSFLLALAANGEISIRKQWI